MSFTNIIIIMAIALVLFGPEDLPKFARALGKIVNSVRKMTSEFTKEFDSVKDAPEKMLMNAFDDSKSGSRSTTKNTPKAVETFAEDGEDDEEEELLSYDAPALKKKTEDQSEINQDPLAGLPAEMVSYEKAKDTSR